VSILVTVAVVAVAAIAAFMGLQLLLVRRMQRKQGQPAPELDGTAGKAISGGKSALFYFHSPMCGACKTMTPEVERLARSHQGRVFPVDISVDMATARSFGVMATPTTIVVERGVIQQVLIGPQPKTRLEGLVAV